jgi:hypothetical protein
MDDETHDATRRVSWTGCRCGTGRDAHSPRPLKGTAGSVHRRQRRYPAAGTCPSRGKGRETFEGEDERRDPTRGESNPWLKKRPKPHVSLTHCFVKTDPALP